MGWDAESKYFSGQGVVLMGKRGADGKPEGLRPVGNVSELTINIETTSLEHKEAQTGQRAIDLRITTETNVGLAITLESFDKENFELSLRGTQSDVTGASVTAEAAKAYPGLVTPLNRMKVSSVVVKQGVATLTPYVNDATPWDYKVNTEAGSLLFNTVADGDALALDSGEDYSSITVDYTFATQSVVDALTLGAQELYMRFEGLNTARENEPVVIEIFKFLVDPLQTLGLISDEVQNFQMEGSVLADSLRASGSKFFRITQVA